MATNVAAPAEVLINFYGRDKSLACVCGSAPFVSYYSRPRGEMKKIKLKRLRLRFSLSPSRPHSLGQMFRSRGRKNTSSEHRPSPFGKSQLMDTVDFHLTAALFCINFHKSLFFGTKTLKYVLYNSARVHYIRKTFFSILGR